MQFGCLYLSSSGCVRHVVLRSFWELVLLFFVCNVILCFHSNTEVYLSATDVGPAAVCIHTMIRHGCAYPLQVGVIPL